MPTTPKPIQARNIKQAENVRTETSVSEINNPESLTSTDEYLHYIPYHGLSTVHIPCPPLLVSTTRLLSDKICLSSHALKFHYLLMIINIINIQID